MLPVHKCSLAVCHHSTGRYFVCVTMHLSWLHATVLYWRQVLLFSRLLYLCALHRSAIAKNLFLSNVRTGAE